MNSPSPHKPATRSPRILHADAHVGIRRGAKFILQQKFRRMWFGEAHDAPSTLAQLRKKTWDLLILDRSLPGPAGIDIFHLVKKQWPTLPVLVFTVHDEAKFAPQLLAAGANGYLKKTSAGKELCAAVATVLQGGTYLTPALVQQMDTAANPPKPKASKVKLSCRETQVLKLFVSGNSGKAAGEALGLSEKTISTYRSRIFRKLNIDNFADLMRYALRERLA